MPQVLPRGYRNASLDVSPTTDSRHQNDEAHFPDGIQAFLDRVDVVVMYRTQEVSNFLRRLNAIVA